MRTLPAKAIVASAVFAMGTVAMAQPGQINYFRQIASYGVVGGIAEIVTASPDGNTLAYSDASGGRIGFVDVTNPANPVALPDVVTGGEPTSVSWAGNVVVAAVKIVTWSEGQPAPDPSDPGNAGALFVIDASNPQAPSLIGTVAIGFQPDSVKLVLRGRAPVAVVCIENEPIVVDENELVIDEDIPGFPTSGATFPQDRSLPGAIQVVTLDLANVASSNVATVALTEAMLTRAGLLFPADAQPEYVDVHGDLAAVTLQENNGVAVVDIAHPLRPQLVRLFSTGNASERLTDLTEDDAISFVQGYPSSIGTTIPAPTDGSGNQVPGGPRQADAIAFHPNGRVLYTADEGELNFTGGRGWSGWAVDGTQVFDDNGGLETVGLVFGQYPEGRSENRGVEIEGVTTATFGRTDYAFVSSERGSYVGVYDVTNPVDPILIQFLPCGISPEGLVAIPQRGLFVTADEVSGTLTIFRGTSGLPIRPSQPLLYSFDGAFGALSSLEAAPAGFFSVNDNALPTTIFYGRLGGPLAPIYPLIPVTVNGAQARYDGEGIVRDESIIAGSRFFGGFFLASEGNGSSQPNLIVQTTLFGEVLREIQLPANIDAAADPSVGGNAVGSAGGGTIRGNGFEGVTLSPSGRYLYACIQRQFNGEGATHTRIARYDLRQIANGTAPTNGLRTGGDWEFFYYPLEAATGAGWIGLSEIVAVTDEHFLVIERDQGIGAPTALKAVYAFSIEGRVVDTDGQPGEASGDDVVTKRLVRDVQGNFFPYEKVEGVMLLHGDLWVNMDNDGGEVENRIVNTGRFRDPFRR
ncbi:MAG: esterase-like activity of phytase family protein [Planctomycetes bacterium]|nr:esterase-like activity of phytase family protein [Planctomycetota bacterium]